MDATAFHSVIMVFRKATAFQGCFEYSRFEYKYEYEYFTDEYEYEYEYRSHEYEYEYEYSAYEYEYEYKYFKFVLELYSSTSTSTEYYISAAFLL